MGITVAGIGTRWIFGVLKGIGPNLGGSRAAGVRANELNARYSVDLMGKKNKPEKLTDEELPANKRNAPGLLCPRSR
jgi:hypothetical protein